MSQDFKSSKGFKKIPVVASLTYVVTKVIDRGVVIFLRLHKKDGQTKCETVFDWDTPEYADLFESAKETKQTRSNK